MTEKNQYHDKNLNWDKTPMDKKKEQPDILSAIGDRAKETPKTEDEIVTQAMRNANAEKMVQNLTATPIPQQTPQGELKTVSTTPTTPELNVTTDVSNGESQPVITNSTPESQELPRMNKTEILQAIKELKETSSFELLKELAAEYPDFAYLTTAPDDTILPGRVLKPFEENFNLRRLRDYIDSSEYSPDWVLAHLTNVFCMPKVIPSVTLWNVPNNFDIAKLICTTVKMPGYIENTWPVLEVVMGNSIGNLEWCASVLTSAALFDCIKLLPHMLQMENPR